jgi:CRP/FNR family transcriptional regulator, cyclic AMP receptor protein
MATPALQDELQFPTGAVICRQGDPGHEMFVISRGRVRLTIGREGIEKEVALLGPGEFFGELSLLSDAPRSATAVAVEDSILLAIGRDVFGMMVQDDLDIVFRMMHIQGRRLSQTNQPIETLMQQLGRVRVAAHGLRRVRAAGEQLPVGIGIGALAAELSLNPAMVGGIVADLVRQGAGTLAGDEWRIADGAEAGRLVDALCGYADDRAV